MPGMWLARAFSNDSSSPPTCTFPRPVPVSLCSGFLLYGCLNSEAIFMISSNPDLPRSCLGHTFFSGATLGDCQQDELQAKEVLHPCDWPLPRVFHVTITNACEHFLEEL